MHLISTAANPGVYDYVFEIPWEWAPMVAGILFVITLALVFGVRSLRKGLLDWAHWVEVGTAGGIITGVGICLAVAIVGTAFGVGVSSDTDRAAEARAWNAETVAWLAADYGVDVDPSQLKELLGDGRSVRIDGDLVFARIIDTPEGDLAVLADGQIVDPTSK